jgi:hypothetical protein
MSTHDELDRLVSDQLRTDAPGQAPAWLLEDTMNRIADTPQRSGRGVLGSTGGRLLAAAVLVLAVVAGTQLAGLIDRPSGTGDSPSPSPSGAPSESAAPSATPSAQPTDAATPSPTAASGELPTGPADAVMSFSGVCDISGPVDYPDATVLEDGRVIWADGAGHFLVRQLTPLSLGQFRAQVESTGLFGESAQYNLERRPGTPEPPGHGLCVWSFVWNDGVEEIRVDSVGWLGDEEESTYYQPAPERKTLDELATQLSDPTTWYGDDGWVQPDAVVYEPEEYLVLASVGPPQMATLGAPDLDDVTWPFEELPDEFGFAYGGGQPPSRCGIADAASIETLAAELSASDLEQFDLPALIGAGVSLPWAARDAAVDISFWPMLPDGRPVCEAADL